MEINSLHFHFMLTLTDN